MEGDTHWVTGGIGYRSVGTLLDAAIVYKTQMDDLTVPASTFGGQELVIDASPFRLRNYSTRGLITLGYRF